MNITFLGAPGSGKGTQGTRLAKRLGIPHISTGDLLREIAASGSELGKEVAAIMERGDLVSDELLMRVLKQRLETAEHANGFILDGTPRNLEQARLIEGFAPIDHAILVDVPDSVVEKRIGARRVCPKDHREYNLLFNPPKDDGVCDDCGTALVQRHDDTPEGVAHRLEVYHSLTEPVIAFYEEKGCLLRVDGDRPIEDVAADINGQF